MASMEGPTSPARLRKVTSQLPCASWRADEADGSRRMAFQSAHLRRTTAPRASSTLATVGIELAVHRRDGARAGPTAMMTANRSAWRCMSNIGPMVERGAELREDARSIGLVLDGASQGSSAEGSLGSVPGDTGVTTQAGLSPPEIDRKDRQIACRVRSGVRMLLLANCRVALC